MALMNVTTFNGFADRIAAQYSYFKSTFDTVSNSSRGTEYYDRITTSDEPDVELALLQPSYNADQWFRTLTTNSMVRTYTQFTTLIPSFETSLRNDGSLTDQNWDGYCEAVDTQVSDYTNQVYWCSKNDYMLARNVWCEDEKTIASCVISGGSLNFTAGDTLYDGNYEASQKADGDYFAASAMKIKVTGSQTIASMNVTIHGEDEQGNTGQSEAVVITNIAPDAYTGETTNKFLKVTSVTLNSGGVNGDTFEVVNAKPRAIAF